MTDSSGTASVAGISATTRVVGVIGDPVEHSLSPTIHNAAFAATGLDWVYVAFPAPAGRGEAAVAAVRDLGIVGLNVTMPHKGDAARACDSLSDLAQRLRSVNTVIRHDDGSLHGDSTDGAGFVRSLGDADVDPAGLDVLVLGAGGAARAIAVALEAAGARVAVAARRSEAGREAVAMLERGEVVAFEALEGALEASDVLVNATPIGMHGEPPPFDPALLRADLVVADLVYEPATTPLLAAAEERGARTVGGLGMLVHQAALAFELWTGVEAPLDAMREAVHVALA